MANFTPSKKTASDFNAGTKYVDYDPTIGQNGDEVQADTINNLVESQLWTQSLATNHPVVGQDSTTGETSVSIETISDGTPRFSFVNIKGQSIYTITDKFYVYNSQEVIADSHYFVNTYGEHFYPNIGDIIMDVDGKIGVVQRIQEDSYYCKYISSIAGGLVYKPLIYDERYEAQISSEFAVLNIADFNRTPIVGETFVLYVYASQENYGLKLYPMSVYSVGQTTIEVKPTGNFIWLTSRIQAEANIDGNNPDLPASVVVQQFGNFENIMWNFIFSNIKGAKGDNGAPGKGIQSITSKAFYTQNDETITTQLVTYTDGTTQTISAYAQNGKNGRDGATGSQGVGITNIAYSSTDPNGNYIYTITLSNNQTYNITVPKGDKGETGATPDVSNFAEKSELDKYLPLTGGTVNGNISVNGDITARDYIYADTISASFIKTSAVSDLFVTPTRYCVLDSQGKIYYRTKEEMIADLGISNVTANKDESGIWHINIGV